MISNSHLDKHTLLGTENSTIEVLDRDDIVRTARQNIANNMAASHDQLIAATPTSMGIPPECRARILEIVLEEELGIIRLEGLKYGVHGDDFGGLRDKTDLVFVPHPFLLVSKKVPDEASQYHRVTLSIDNFSESRKVIVDDFRKNLSPFLRRAVSKVIVNSVSGYQGRHINQEQFSNLKSVNVGSLVEGQLDIVHRKREVHYTITPTAHFNEV